MRTNVRLETQQRILRDVFASLESGQSLLGPERTTNDPGIYWSPKRHAFEERTLFRRFPLVAGLSARVRNAGDFFTDDLGPVPTLVVRGDDGVLRAFANACRHRGSKLAEGHGSATNGFSCPYHAWCYDLAGRLETIPDEYGFEGIDRDAHHLIELPVEERYGLVWVHPTPGADLDVRSYLGMLGDDLESYGADRCEVQATDSTRRKINWKMASDTFWEAYHLRVLHARTLGNLYARNLCHFEAFGPHHRFMGIRSTVRRELDRPEAERELVPHATILNNIFPNTIFIMQKDHIEVFRVFPNWGRTNESITEANVLVPKAGPEWSDTMKLVLGVIDEDYTLSEGIQRNFETGLLPHVNYGRYEAAVEHFHHSIRAALAEHA